MPRTSLHVLPCCHENDDSQGTYGIPCWTDSGTVVLTFALFPTAASLFKRTVVLQPPSEPPFGGLEGYFPVESNFDQLM